MTDVVVLRVVKLSPVTLFFEVIFYREGEECSLEVYMMQMVILEHETR